MNEQQTTCDQCGRMTEAGAFCEHCCAELKPADISSEDTVIERPSENADISSQPTATDNHLSPIASATGEQPQQTTNNSQDLRALEEEIRSKLASAETVNIDDDSTLNIPPLPTSNKQPTNNGQSTTNNEQRTTDNGQPAPSQRTTNNKQPISPISECEDFIVEYNEARVFLEGSMSAFNFSVTPSSDEAATCRDIQIRVESHGYLSTSLKKTFFDRNIQKGKSLQQANLNLKPEQSGLDIGGEIYFTYKKGRKKIEYYCSFLWDVYPPSEPPGKIIENLSIKLDSVSDRAGDSESTLNMLNGLNIQAYSKAEDLKKLRLPPVWNPLELCECGEGEEDPPPEAHIWSTTLSNSQNELLHIISKPSLQLGRNRACDVVTRIMDRSGWADPEVPSKLGKFHCHIENSNGTCNLVDMGHDTKSHKRKPSVWGTFFNGRKLPAGQSVALPLDKGFSISLAGADHNDPQAFTFSAYIWSCQSLGKCGKNIHDKCNPHDPACMILQRIDGIPETFLVVWKFAPLQTLEDHINTKFGEISLLRRKGSFCYSLPNSSSNSGWLVPGETIEGMQVEKYRQFGEWAER